MTHLSASNRNGVYLAPYTVVKCNNLEGAFFRTSLYVALKGAKLTVIYFLYSHWTTSFRIIIDIALIHLLFLMENASAFC